MLRDSAHKYVQKYVQTHEYIYIFIFIYLHSFAISIRFNDRYCIFISTSAFD